MEVNSPNQEKSLCNNRITTRITTPKPFSFDSRNSEFARRKSEVLQQIIKNETTRRSFRARPVPSSTYSPKRVHPASHNSQNDRNLKAEKINLRTQRRAVQRADYDRKLKEKEILVDELKKKVETEKMLKEKLETMRLRQATVFKARPVKKYNKT